MQEIAGSNPAGPIKREWLRHERNRPHYHCVYRIHGRIFSRRDSDPLIAFRGSGPLDRRSCRNAGIHLASLTRNSQDRPWLVERSESLVMGSLLLLVSVMVLVLEK